MGEVTGIEWTHHTFNPWLGCSKVSPACTNCYAESNRAVAAASARVGAELWGQDAARAVTSESYWRQPYKWFADAQKAGERRRVFCASLADVFEDRADLDEHRQRLFRVIWDTQGSVEGAPGLDWLLLTKRPEKIRELVLRAWSIGTTKFHNATWLKAWGDDEATPRNIWIGTTAENQEQLDKRAAELARVRARVRFLSCEPLLGPLDVSRWLHTGRCRSIGPAPERSRCGLPKDHLGDNDAMHYALTPTGYPWSGIGAPIDWVIAGGESGSSARPMHPDWARSIRDQCAASGVPFFFKQWGEWQAGSAPARDPDRERIMLNDGRLIRDPGELSPADRYSKTWGPAGWGANVMTRVGKKAAGALLEGRELKQFPEVARD